MLSTHQLLEQLKVFGQNNDDAAAREFILEHVNEFPEDIRDELVFQFAADSLVNDAEFETLKRSVATAIDILEKAKEEDENDLKVLDLKDQLSK